MTGLSPSIIGRADRSIRSAVPCVRSHWLEWLSHFWPLAGHAASRNKGVVLLLRASPAGAHLLRVVLQALGERAAPAQAGSESSHCRSSRPMESVSSSSPRPTYRAKSPRSRAHVSGARKAHSRLRGRRPSPARERRGGRHPAPPTVPPPQHLQAMGRLPARPTDTP